MVSIPNDAAQGGQARRAARSGDAAIKIWLYTVAALVLLMVVVGGATRLTNSGLSITEWQPIIGTIPPLSDADWQDAFQKYQQIPQYKLINRGMSLAEFKFIYWWEWSHRLLGRLIGVVFFVPFLVFWLRGMIGAALWPKLLGIFLLGGAQGAMGWYMVASGLVERTSVSQYRLTAHLALAVTVIAAILWVAFGLGRDRRIATPVAGLKTGASVLVALIFLQILAGGFTAGTHAGLSHNTWPLMDGALIPGGLWVMEPWYANLFENVLTVQFNHRIIGYAVALIAIANAVAVWRAGVPSTVRLTASLLVVAVLAQITLGVFTVLTQVQIGIALAHQAVAVALFGLALYHLHRLRAP